ncbi:hypothetical protein [Burkholderia sp. PR2]|uniref:hypothetical protein n=1 Tax=Burkholderia sp. PR2 TaxID=3448078 RepID=UPI00402ADDBA
MSSNKRLTTLPSNTTVDDILECFELDGGCIVQNMLSPETLEGLWADIGRELDGSPEGDGEFVGRHTRRVSGLFNRSLRMETLITQPKLYEAAERWLVKPFRYWLNDKQCEAIP